MNKPRLATLAAFFTIAASLPLLMADAALDRIKAAGTPVDQLQAILRDDVYKTRFINWALPAATKALNAENILFLRDAKKIPVATLYTTYIKTGSPKEVNLPSGIRASIDAAVNKKAVVNLDPAITEICRLVLTNLSTTKHPLSEFLGLMEPVAGKKTEKKTEKK